MRAFAVDQQLCRSCLTGSRARRFDVAMQAPHRLFPLHALLLLEVKEILQLVATGDEVANLAATHSHLVLELDNLSVQRQLVVVA